MTDPIADLLSRIRNGLHARHDQTLVPHSNLKLEIVRILYEEGFIGGYKVLEGEKGKGNLPKGKRIEISLKLPKGKRGVISEIRRTSRPGRRVYLGCRELRPLRNGMGVTILSTPKGVLTDAQAREQKVGGEPLCTVW